ncbi:MAG TPA: hypoxanthine phosphoribosyltransferase [Nitrospirae bacterium]|nr:hypoxanthine phosphoribosyltransferase [bacterium BMS3Abin10]GBE39437.1 hypoxanthine phosphoribosyltransferase [bacterium BMS3Bbin08]HDH50737.1 hypoxanthine phosphoribosyltransferase [Nitrospirota bacterium]HDK16805.1 hypoxanthine phosphoribosyltransferase [Nitrospirota bacterium]HDK81718.1 hypoxanthine phosphoribosyltransferase [Nitrospirota bacterium]
MITGKPLYTVEQIQQRVKEMAGQISKDYEGEELLSVGILRGSFMFFSDIVKLIRVPMNIDFLIASSYVKTHSTGKIKLHADIREDIKGRHVLLIEDIVDTGLTLAYIREMLLARKPASLKICTFLDKKSRREVDVPLDYVGFEIPNKYVVGYGLDCENKFRNLPYIVVFKKSS